MRYIPYELGDGTYGIICTAGPIVEFKSKGRIWRWLEPVDEGSASFINKHENYISRKRVPKTVWKMLAEYYQMKWEREWEEK